MKKKIIHLIIACLIIYVINTSFFYFEIAHCMHREDIIEKIEEIAKSSANGTGGFHSSTITEELCPTSHADTANTIINVIESQVDSNSPEFVSTGMTSNDLEEEKTNIQDQLHDTIVQYHQSYTNDNPNIFK